MEERRVVSHAEYLMIKAFDDDITLTLRYSNNIPRKMKMILDIIITHYYSKYFIIVKYLF